MSAVAAVPRLSPHVVIHAMEGEDYDVAKHAAKRSYLKLTKQESFLLNHFDGVSSHDAVIESFNSQFEEPLTRDEFEQFVQMATSAKLIASESESTGPAQDVQFRFRDGLVRAYRSARQQSLFYFRIHLFNPERILLWLEPRTRWLFARTMGIIVAAAGSFALFLVLANRAELLQSFVNHWNWRTLGLFWLTIVGVTICHEFGHGLVCKRYGGEVHEMGALWIFLTPCLYCNVSDAWLLPSRRKRLHISLAGTYVDFVIWILAVLVWRLAAPHTIFHYMAWIVVTTCGLRVLFNINPLLRLDGYYALSDVLGVDNLRRRGRQRWLEHVRWVFWGGQRPQPTEDGRALFVYGVSCWLFTVVFLGLLFFKLATFLNSFIGIAGIIAGATIFSQLSKRYFRGSLGEDFRNMFNHRRKRAMIWGGIVLAVLLVPIYDRAGGPFHVRPAMRLEVRSPVAGFLREVRLDEGDEIDSGRVLARIEVPGLASQISQKNAEILEVKANLKRLEAGNRREVIAEQQAKIKRAVKWRDLAIHDLKKSRVALTADLAQFDLQISQAKAEVKYRDKYLLEAERLHKKGGLAGQQLLAIRKRQQDAQFQLEQVGARKRVRQAQGVLTFEAELARREKELADSRSDLFLLEAGSRPEDLEAQRARLKRLQEELAHLQEMKKTELVICPRSGTVTTPRLREKIGQFMDKGALICLVEDLVDLEAEIAIAEQDARVLVPGQRVTLKPRSLPMQTLSARVDRIAPAAQLQKENIGQSTVTVYCRVDNGKHLLRTGMTGYGRIRHKMRPLGWIAVGWVLRVLRTEFYF